ncbi:hypothetical protein OIDMADRAFT_176694 [Oidiodendron maius Zn]|uniref:Uncharacterized protein n=1 Tax=Oidiodendron maius (strain Zn) TaxID=913774 RepID=A0A0C3DX30_OIDMZ|nr:hypothetical protein OIDMADRAFT_176694 [Oidiodendron maius Zn]
MDVAYNQHSPRARSRGRSSLNLNQLSLAPLTSRFPLPDYDAAADSTHHISYIEGRSAPTTPSILSRSSSRVSLHRPTLSTGIPKSKSSTHLLAVRSKSRTVATPLSTTDQRRKIKRDELSEKDRSDLDWLLRAGTAISFSARESKGQAWLVSRASSTSLSGLRDEDEEEFENELAREREQTSRRGSGNGLFDADDEFSPGTTRRSLSFGPATGTGSRPLSRFGSRANSRRGSRVQLFTPLGGEREGYFDQRELVQEEFLAEPDFVDVEEEGFENMDQVLKDEDIVRRLAGASSLGLTGWVERMLGWSLFAVEEDGEETEVDTLDTATDDSESPSRPSKRNLKALTETTIEDRPLPLQDGEAGAWQDAAWLLSVATKALL